MSMANQKLIRDAGTGNRVTTFELRATHAIITVESVIPGSSDIVSRTCEEIRQAEVFSQFPILRTHLLSADCPETTFDDIAIAAEDE